MSYADVIYALGGADASPARGLIQVKAPGGRPRGSGRMWQPIATAPYGDELQLAVIDRDGEHCLVFPCRRTADGWLHAATGARIDVRPTHWRAWQGKD